MKRVQLGYEFINSEVEGFIGYGFADYSAEENCESHMREACAKRGENFNPRCIIRSERGLTMGQSQRIRADWKAKRQALKDKGASIY